MGTGIHSLLQHTFKGNDYSDVPVAVYEHTPGSVGNKGKNISYSNMELFWKLAHQSVCHSYTPKDGIWISPKKNIDAVLSSGKMKTYYLHLNTYTHTHTHIHNTHTQHTHIHTIWLAL